MIQYSFSPPIPSRIGNETMDLSKNTQVISNEELKNAWTATAGSCLFFYIKPEVNDRTSVSGNEYANAVQIGSTQILQILIAPDAGRGYASAPARLQVFLKDTSVPENIDIQNLPLQRWSAVAIVKEGRRFNIYVNGRLTASHVCNGMPDFDQTQPLRIGDPRLGGTIALMSLSAFPMGIDAISSLVSTTSSIDGAPYLSSGFASFIPIPSFNLSSLSMCPGGNCNSAPINGNPGPLRQWTSSYA
jgi:hypothetical protein